ncbi:Tyrosine-protein kinase receptor Tie-1 [Holothuria leucospilota]|uniref:Tyrosine-protein kinase receptor Tie-1 n=1 Tax=Holothuria leucospilota TaxID=206669 RepID=A0A9Q1BZY0_HOLLE|nr:Tyrosine-protein kinase receptor Tie-1 [Holothuria leucospilota]
MTDSTLLIKNAFIQKCFAYEVKIYAFPDALFNDGLNSAEFESCYGDLPKGAVTKDIGFEIGTKGQVLCLPNQKGCYEKGNSRTGVFRATLTANSETEEFIAIVNPDSDLKSVSPVTQTISQGETADLEVDYSAPFEIVWTYDGPSPNKWKGQLKITVDQPGIYQVFSKKSRDERLTFRVIKRACTDGMYGAECDMSCDANCGDGKGVCDDVDGTCICTPGFMGADCSTGS